MFVKFIHKLLAFDHREKPLDVERSSASMAEKVWDEVVATDSSSKISSQHASPPLTYQSSVFMGTRTRGGEEPRSDTEAGKTRPAAKPTRIRGITEKILKGTMASQALQLLEDAMEDGDERRAFGREPYVHPAMLKLENDEDRHSAFIRDVSVSGVGLIHFVPIEPQRISILTRRRNDDVLDVLVDIAWCVPCGEGCYMSGGTFVTSPKAARQAILGRIHESD